MKTTFDGVIVGEEIEVRFAFGGKISWVGKKQGDTVKQSEAIASLDRKILQTQLDLELADYEKVRADFELFTIKFGKENGDDTTKYLRQEKQAQLNASVKQVEIAKYQMDQADMISPVTGVILDMGGIATGLNVTPASSSVTVGKTDMYQFLFSVQQEEVQLFMKPQQGTVKIAGVDKEFSVTTLLPLWGKDGEFVIQTSITDQNLLIPGMNGEIRIETGK